MITLLSLILLTHWVYYYHRYPWSYPHLKWERRTVRLAHGKAYFNCGIDIEIPDGTILSDSSGNLYEVLA